MTLRELGTAGEFDTSKLQPFEDPRDLAGITNRPTKLPQLKDDEAIFALYDRGIKTKVILCETLKDMQKLWDTYAKGFALHLQWRKGISPIRVIKIK